MRGTLQKVRSRLLREIGKSVRRNAPHPSIASSVKVSAAQVRIDHRAAGIFEFGAKPHFPPLGPIRAWMVSVGKDPSDAYAIARSIAGRGLGGKRGSRGGFEAQPYIRPAIATAMDKVPGWMRELWERGR